MIAIENVRLYEAEQQRTREPTETLEQQTATSEVLEVIGSSPGDLQPVFQSMLENAVRICDAKFGNIYRWDGELMHLLAAHNTPPALAEARRRSAFRPTSMVRQMVETKKAAQAVVLRRINLTPMSTISPLFQIMAGTRRLTTRRQPQSNSGVYERF